MRFSGRYGYKPVREVFQIESMNEDLRNGVWSVLDQFIWSKEQTTFPDIFPDSFHESNPELSQLCFRLWFSYFKNPTDEIGSNWRVILSKIRTHFFQCKWYEVYDFLEFVVANYDQHRFQEQFCKACNSLFEREMSAYRFVNRCVTRLTDNHEISAIEQAVGSKIGPVRTHIQRALELLSDRSSPDYRNSIKESISAVESLVRQVSGASKGTLGQLVNKLENEVGLHPALRDSFKKLYGYTSDEDGIRHAIMEKSNHDYHDAKFMLVICSAFINYVEGKFEDKL